MHAHFPCYAIVQAADMASLLMVWGQYNLGLRSLYTTSMSKDSSCASGYLITHKGKLLRLLISHLLHGINRPYVATEYRNNLNALPESTKRPTDPLLNHQNTVLVIKNYM